MFQKSRRCIYKLLTTASVGKEKPPSEATITLKEEDISKSLILKTENRQYGKCFSELNASTHVFT